MGIEPLTRYSITWLLLAGFCSIEATCTTSWIWHALDNCAIAHLTLYCCFSWIQPSSVAVCTQSKVSSMQNMTKKNLMNLIFKTGRHLSELDDLFLVHLATDPELFLGARSTCGCNSTQFWPYSLDWAV